MAVMRTFAPGSTCDPGGATASQYSPRTWTFPAGARAVIATPASPNMPADPVITLLARARTTSVSSSDVISAKGSASAIATVQRMRSSGSGRIDQQHRAQHHRDRAAQTENSVRREFGFEGEQHERQHQQRRAGPVDGQHGKRGEAQQNGNGAGDAWGDQARRAELGINTQGADHDQNERDVRIGDGRNDSLPQVGLIGDDGGACQAEPLLAAVEANHFTAIELGEQVLLIAARSARSDDRPELPFR